MPRPKKFESNAARVAAHRERMKEKFVEVDREQFELLSKRLERLHNAIREAYLQGDLTAKHTFASSLETTLDNLIDHFEEQASFDRAK